MASIDESALAGKIRDRPINLKLRKILLAAAEDADVDVIRVISGGQPGSTGQSTGSHRHDGGNAADIDLVKDGRVLSFTNQRDLETFRKFVTSAAARGAIGIGAGVKYMGPTRIHVGFGNGPADNRQIVWGAQNASANAPAWLRQAADRGWANPIHFDSINLHEGIEDSSEGESMEDAAWVERFRPLLDFIAHHEGTAREADDGYNTSLGYGRYLPGRTEIDLVNKTLDQISEIGYRMRKQPGNPNSSALGRYQIVGQTMRALQRKRGLPGTTKFSREIQDLFATDLIRECGKDAQKLAGQWASLKKVSAKDILAAYDKEGTMTPTPFNPESLDLADLIRQLLQGAGAGAVKGAAEGGWPILQQGTSSEEAVKRLQSLLNELRYYTGGIDGRFGSITRGAVALFQLDNALPVTGAADAETWAALTNGSARPLTEQRVAITAAELKRDGSQTIKNADFVRISGWLAGLLGAGGLTKGGACTVDPTLAVCLPTGSTADSLSTASLQNIDALVKLLASANTNPNAPQITNALESIRQVLLKIPETAPQVASSDFGSILTSGLVGLLPGGWAGSLLALGLGFAVNKFGNNIINRRVADQRDGKHIGFRPN